MAINYTIVENDTKGFQSAMETEMVSPIKHFERELAKIRTGRAHTSLIEDIPVMCYGQTMPLKSVGVIAAPDVRLLTVEPWDASIINDIMKAITLSDIGLSPATDGKIIRLQLPEMSTSRREELAKILNKKLNECKDSIKGVRKDFNNLMRDAKKDKTISEDFFNRLGDILQKVTEKITGQAEALAEKKEKEIKTV